MSTRTVVRSVGSTKLTVGCTAADPGSDATVDSTLT
jgi:hypothetical protein